MPRAKRGNKRLERRKKILKLAKGYRGTKSKLYRSAKESVERGLNFAYTGSKLKKRDFRSLYSRGFIRFDRAPNRGPQVRHQTRPR